MQVELELLLARKSSQLAGDITVIAEKDEQNDQHVRITFCCFIVLNPSLDFIFRNQKEAGMEDAHKFRMLPRDRVLRQRNIDSPVRIS